MLRLLAVVLIIAGWTFTTAHATSLMGGQPYKEVREQNERVCSSYGGVQWFTLVLPRVGDPAACTANCFGYLLYCKSKGAQAFAMTSRYYSYSDDHDIFWHESGGFFKLLLIALFSAYGVIATYGAKPIDRQQQAIANAVCVGLISLDILLWGLIAIDWGPSQFMEISLIPLISYVVVPVFVIMRAMAVRRGWDYLFVRHPAEPLVSPAAQSDRPVDTGRIAETLVKGADDPGIKPVYHYEHQAAQARQLKDELDAKAAEAEAKALRELRRKEFIEAKQHLDAVKRGLENKR